MSIIYSKLKVKGSRKKKAYDNLDDTANDIIGGHEDVLMDYEDGSTEYARAQESLKDHDERVISIYFEGIHDFSSIVKDIVHQIISMD